MKKSFIVFIFLFITAFTSPLPAEIENIVIQWNAAQCLNICTPNMEKNFSAIKGVTELQINPQAGTAAMKWSPNTPFSFYPFSLAAGATGPRILDIRVRVKGTITYDPTNVYLISLGDGTQFLLLGPAQATPGYYIPRRNVSSHPITPALRQQLMDAAARRQLITIEGPLFQPYRYSLALVAEQVKVPPPNPNEFNRYLRR